MKIGIVLYPTFGGSGVVATELGKALAKKGHEIHFITYSQPVRLGRFRENIFYHEVSVSDYPSRILSVHGTKHLIRRRHQCPVCHHLAWNGYYPDWKGPIVCPGGPVLHKRFERGYGRI